MQIKFTLLVILSVLLLACAGESTHLSNALESGDVTQMKALRDSLKGEEAALYEKLAQLDEAIAMLDTTEKFPLITVQRMEAEEFIHFSEFQGDIVTDDNVVIYPEYAGTMNSVSVKTGDRVSKGQVLARIEDGGLSQQRAALQIQVDLAKTTFEKQSRLWEKKIGSEMQYLQAKTAYEGQKASLEQMDSQLAKTTIRAPFSGVIDEIMTKQGSVVAPGMSPIMRIVSLRDMYVEVSVPEAHLATMSKGQFARVEIPVLHMSIDSKIRNVASFINPASRTFKVELAVPDKSNKIKPNLNAKVHINDYSNAKALLIPQSVISEDAEGREYVYIVTEREQANAVAQRVYVELGKTNGGQVEVTEGLQVGDEVVIEGARAISDGLKVEILTAKNDSDGKEK